MADEYPKMLYRAGSAFRWEGCDLDCRIVSDEADEATARADGWAGLDETTDAEPPKRGRPRKVAA